jgi:signal transduction histidine kinase
MVALAFEDEGPGIASADRTCVFEPFWHGQGSSTGVGLSICKAIVEAHGGGIHVEDGARGARFVFTVPAHHD